MTEYLVEQTKDLHLNVVRADLGVLRHLHPTMADDGTWTAPVSLPGVGAYRVIAEFVARGEGGDGDHVILGQTREVTDGPRSKADQVDPVVQVDVTQAPRVGPNGLLRLVSLRGLAQRTVPDKMRGHSRSTAAASGSERLDRFSVLSLIGAFHSWRRRPLPTRRVATATW